MENRMIPVSVKLSLLFDLLRTSQQDRGSDIPRLVSMEHEQSDMPVLDYYRNTARLDLVLVPATQISPSGVCTPHPDPEPPRSQATSGQQSVTAFDAP